MQLCKVLSCARAHLGFESRSLIHQPTGRGVSKLKGKLAVRSSVCCKARETVMNWKYLLPYRGFPGGSVGKESTRNAGHLGSIPELRRSPGEGNGYPLQYSGLENSTNSIVHGLTKNQTWLSDFHFFWKTKHGKFRCKSDSLYLKPHSLFSVL